MFWKMYQTQADQAIIAMNLDCHVYRGWGDLEKPCNGFNKHRAQHRQISRAEVSSKSLFSTQNASGFVAKWMLSKT